MTTKTYRVGIIGFGFIGKVHAHAYLNLPYYYDPVPLQARITHVCTSRVDTAEMARAFLGADTGTTDYREITENPDVDIVHICTPNHLHKDALLSAMAHGKAIYCDKPIVMNMAEAEEVRAALPRYKGTAQMTFQNRFYPATIRAKEIIEEGRVGRVLEFRACSLHSGSTDPEVPLKWKLSAAAGGGVIADLASHVMDMVSYLVGDFAALLADTHIAYPDRPSPHDPTDRLPVDAEDCVMMLARTKGGALGNIEGTKIATGTEDEFRFEIHGTRGALRFNGMDAHHLGFYDATLESKPSGGRRGWTLVDTGQRYAPPAAAFPGPKFSIGWLRGHLACLAGFLQAVADGRPGEPGLERGLKIQEWMAACRESAATRAWVDVG